MKEIFAPHLNRNVKLGGRRRPVNRPQRRPLNHYLRLSLPPPPQSCDYSQKGLSALRQMYLNDQLGDCVIAGGYHVVGVETGNATSSPFIATNQQIIKDYGKIGGYNPNDPNSDQGCDEQTALNYWQQTGFANGTKLLGWLPIDATNKTEVMTACWLFENLYFGIELPDAWINPFPSADNFVWGVAGAADPDNGHCIIGCGYDATKGVMVDTWGLLGWLTFGAISKYCVDNTGGMLYVMLTPDQIAKGAQKAPNGVAWSDIITDFDLLGGHVPVPTPTPPTPTPPSPTPPSPTPTAVTLQQAEQWAVAGLNSLRPSSLITPSIAARYVVNSLASHWPKKP